MQPDLRRRRRAPAAARRAPATPRRRRRPAGLRRAADSASRAQLAQRASRPSSSPPSLGEGARRPAAAGSKVTRFHARVQCTRRGRWDNPRHDHPPAADPGLHLALPARTAGAPAPALRRASRPRSTRRRGPAKRPPRWRSAWRWPRRARWRRCTRDAVVIGSDQVADLDGAPIGKPGTPRARRRAVARDARAQRRLPDRRGGGARRDRLRAARRWCR